MTTIADLGGLFDMLIEAPAFHGRSSRHYQFLQGLCRAIISESELRAGEPKFVPFGPFGELVMPYYRMGAIDTIDLFGMDELIIFAFYHANRARYRRGMDVGANVGLHSILMAKCGFDVVSYEPDPVHYELLKRNLALNGIVNARPVMAAVSDHDGVMPFVRVKGNTTGSHLAGAKQNPYGELDRFAVDVMEFAATTQGIDLVKVDAEGHEVTILRSLPPERWQRLDVIVEVGSPENAAALFAHFGEIEVSLFAQAIGWRRVERLADMPRNHRDGSLFISTKPAVPWG